jgi:hypothetical protein
MAVLIEQTMAAVVPISMIEAVTEEMGVEASPPEGMISHVHYEQDGRATSWTSGTARRPTSASWSLVALGLRRALVNITREG